MRDRISFHSNKLGRKVFRIGLQEHSNDMLFYYYRKHLFKDTHPRAFSPILSTNRERALSPNISTIVEKRRSSSGAVFKHSSRLC